MNDKLPQEKFEEKVFSDEDQIGTIQSDKFLVQSKSACPKCDSVNIGSVRVPTGASPNMFCDDCGACFSGEETISVKVVTRMEE